VILAEDVKAACLELRERREWWDCQERVVGTDLEGMTDHRVVPEIAEKTVVPDWKAEMDPRVPLDHLVLTELLEKRVFPGTDILARPV